MNLINKDLAMPGIYRAKLLTDNKLYIPGLSSVNPLKENGEIDTEILNKNSSIFPTALFCAPSEASITTVTPPASCWITFELGDGKRPVVLGYLGKSIPEVTIAGSFGSAGGTASESMKSDNAKKIIEFFVNECGLSVAAACGVLGNALAENSALDPKLEASDGTSTSMGIFMFYQSGHGGKDFENLKAHCGSYSYDSLEGQLTYVKEWFEGKINGYAGGPECKAKLLKVEDSEQGAREAAKIFCEDFEKPGIPHLEKRQQFAAEAYAVYKDGETKDGKYTSPDMESISIASGDIAGYFAWLKTTEGKAAKEHGPGSGTQCVELPNAYIEKTFGLKNNGGFGHGKDYYSGVSSTYPNNFTKIDWKTGSTTLQPGDIVSMSSPSQPAYGHVVLIEKVNGNTITIFDQWKGSGNVRNEDWTLNGNTLTQKNGSVRTIYGIARPK